MSAKCRKIIRLKQVQEHYPKSRVQIWRDVRAGLFPAPVELGPHSIGWFEDEVLARVDELVRRTYGADEAPDEPSEEGSEESGNRGHRVRRSRVEARGQRDVRSPPSPEPATS